MPFNKKRSYDLLKSNKKSTLSSGTFTKKTNPNCKDCPHRPSKSLTPSSSSSSSTGLISRLPKQKNTKNFIKYYEFISLMYAQE